MHEKARKCPKCGAFMPDWADSCLACGGLRSPGVESNVIDTIDLSPLLLRQSKSFSVKIGNYKVKGAHLVDTNMEVMPNGTVRLNIEILGDLQ